MKHRHKNLLAELVAIVFGIALALSVAFACGVLIAACADFIASIV